MMKILEQQNLEMQKGSVRIVQLYSTRFSVALRVMGHGMTE